MEGRIGITAALAALLALAPDASQVGGGEARPADAWSFLLAKYDADEDGVLTRAEYTRGDAPWKNLDVNGDGKVDRKEFEGRGWKVERPKVKPPRKGRRAPDFELEALPPREDPEGGVEKKGGEDEKGKRPPRKPPEPERVKLSSFRGKKPVALIFGSYT